MDLLKIFFNPLLPSLLPLFLLPLTLSLSATPFFTPFNPLLLSLHLTLFFAYPSGQSADQIDEYYYVVLTD